MNQKLHWRLALLYSVAVFLTIVITMGVGSLIMFILYQAGVLHGSPGLVPLAIFWLLCLGLGMGFSRLTTVVAFQRVNRFIEATRAISRGEFDVRIDAGSRVEELNLLAESFNTMADELKKTEIFRSDFVENVSHEFKTPLSAIEGYVTLLQKKDLPEEKRQEYIQKILNNTSRLSTLTGNILLLSRIENQESEIRRESFLLDEQIREILLYLEPKWSEKDLQLELELAECRFCGNHDLLAHVWLNLLDNAIRYSPAGGRLTIILRPEEGHVTVSVADEGPGIPAEDQPRVFEKFYKGDHSRSSKGNGLGLSLAQRIVTLHRGSIRLQSGPGEGSVFTVELPV